MRGRQILVKQQQIVAEVEICLAWIALLQRGTANVVHHTRRHCHYSTATCPDTPAKVNFFHMGKETPVEAACTPEHIASHCKCSPCCPKDGEQALDCIGKRRLHPGQEQWSDFLCRTRPTDGNAQCLGHSLLQREGCMGRGKFRTVAHRGFHR